MEFLISIQYVCMIGGCLPSFALEILLKMLKIVLFKHGKTLQFTDGKYDKLN